MAYSYDPTEFEPVDLGSPRVVITSITLDYEGVPRSERRDKSLPDTAEYCVQYEVRLGEGNYVITRGHLDVEIDHARPNGNEALGNEVMAEVIGQIGVLIYKGLNVVSALNKGLG
jgi:hypothetical protein